MNGKLIVIEGLDGSGKATQTELLYRKWKVSHPDTIKVSFPNYESDSSALIKMYLNGKFGNKPDAVNAYAASCFYAVDRYASYKENWEQFYQSGGIVLADRYTTSNAIHQCAKLPEDQWDEYLEWLFEFEYQKVKIPAPDMVIYLRVDPIVSQYLMDVRYKNDPSKKDIHERDLEYLARSRKAADYCAKKLGWQIIECTDGMEMRSIETIHDDIWSIVKEIEGHKV